MKNSTLSLREHAVLAFMNGFTNGLSTTRKLSDYVRDEMGRDHFANLSRIQEIINFLDHRPEGWKQRVLDKAVIDASKIANPEPLKLVLNLGGNPSFQAAGGATPLMLAAEAGRLENIKILHKAGAYIDQKDGMDRTALFLAFANPNAVVQDNLDVIKYLLDAGADPWVQNKYDMTLDSLVDNNSSLVLYTLLKGARDKWVPQSLNQQANSPV